MATDRTAPFKTTAVLPTMIWGGLWNPDAYLHVAVNTTLSQENAREQNEMTK